MRRIFPPRRILTLYSFVQSPAAAHSHHRERDSTRCTPTERASSRENDRHNQYTAAAASVSLLATCPARNSPAAEAAPEFCAVAKNGQHFSIYI